MSQHYWRPHSARGLPSTTTPWQIVRENDKQRFAFSADGQQIRASQGHSVAIILRWSRVCRLPFCTMATATRFLASIRETGLVEAIALACPPLCPACNRGERRAAHGKPVVLLVQAEAMAAAGFSFFYSDNGVWLTDHVPVQYLTIPA